MNITLPSMPVANDFRDDHGYVSGYYLNALAAWKDVCLRIGGTPMTEKERSDELIYLPVNIPSPKGKYDER